MAHREEPSWLDRGLRVFADVRAGEGFTALLLALNVFLILMAYYVLKPVREALDPRRGLGRAQELHVGRRRSCCWRSSCRSTAGSWRGCRACG